MTINKLIIGNWKLNHDRQSAAVFFADLKKEFRACPGVELAIAPVATMLDFCSSKLAKSSIKLAAQNVFYEPKGAFTGEWSVKNLVELGVSYCIVGHSERRQFFHESDEIVAKKVKACLEAQLIPVCCIGESRLERDHKKTAQVIETQLLAVLNYLDKAPNSEIIFAYEPLWAIGTGLSASKEEAQSVHAQIREILQKKWGNECANNIKILYGGSVNPQNIKEICAMKDVNGALVGGASLQVQTFLSMVRELKLTGIA